MAWNQTDSPAQIERQIRLVAADSSRVRQTTHGGLRAEQRWFSFDDVLNVLRTGSLDPDEPPALDVRGRLQTAMRGKSLDGEAMKVPVGLKEDQRGNLIVVITVIKLDRTK